MSITLKELRTFLEICSNDMALSDDTRVCMVGFPYKGSATYDIEKTKIDVDSTGHIIIKLCEH